jgi:hypothetical protein
MWNAGTMPARMIDVISPAGFAHFFRELADVIAVGPPQPPGHGSGRRAQPAARPAGLAARADLTVPPPSAARRLN